MDPFERDELKLVFYSYARKVGDAFNKLQNMELSVNETKALDDFIKPARENSILQNKLIDKMINEDDINNDELNELFKQSEKALIQRTNELEEINLKYKELSETDPLAKTPNRRAYEMTLTQNIATSKRSSSVLSMLMIDIDYFKSYNDLRRRSIECA